MAYALPESMIKTLRAELGIDGLLLDASECLVYGYDNSRQHALPDMVVLPTTAVQVQTIVHLCRQHKIPLIARGRGTNTTGAAVPIHGGVVVSFERMNRILEIRPGDRMAIVEPGVLNGDLQSALREYGLFWPPDPTSAPYCTVGGNLACNAGGPRAVKYGATRDNILALSAIAGTGAWLHFGATTTKTSTGYDLSRVLIGSEGTLALIVQATLKLTPIAPQRCVLRARYSNTNAAACAVSRIMAQPVTPSMLEFMDGECVRLAHEVGGAELIHANALLMIEADGDATTLSSAVQALQRAANGEGCLGIDSALDDTARERLWVARKALSPALRTIAPGKINEDVVVPVSRIPELVERIEVIAKEQSLKIVCFGHAGNGNLHVNILYDPEDYQVSERAELALIKIFTAVAELEGQLSGEHGIGLSKRDFMPLIFDASTLAMMRSIKAVFDPDGILNPGKLFPL